jgi:ABC-type Fe3+/spermidine/putrescine transport system ATPase subunit
MIEIKKLRIRLGNFWMKEISLKIDTGEYFVILGPTGCGKTVLIECLVGIRKPDSGEIWIDDQNVTDKFPEERHIGYLPQDFALFPTMTVKENIAFGLKAKKKDKRQIQSVVDNLSDLLGISELLSRHIQGLSGGEKQRVALARALATEPKVVFLDEPLSALDENTREKLASELRNIHDRFKTTFVHISHNFEEVAQVADRVALMKTGTVEQIGTVNEILKHPVSRYAAEFTRTKNIFEGTSDLLENGQTVICLANGISMNSCVEYTGKVLVTIRPEEICVSDKAFERSENIFKGKILKACNMGIFTRIDIDIGILISTYMPNHPFNETFGKNNDIVYIHIPPDSVNVIKCSLG